MFVLSLALFCGRAWAEDGFCRMGRPTNEEYGVHLYGGAADGQTVPGSVDGDWACKTLPGSHYFCFSVDSRFVDSGQHDLTITIVARQVTSGAGGNLVYESVTGYKNFGTWWAPGGSDRWYTHTYHVTDASFKNTWGYSFRFGEPGQEPLWIKEVVVRRNDPPPAAVIGKGTKAFGMATSGESRGNHATLYPELRNAGVTLMRAWPEWGRIQPGQSQWDWSECDALLRSAADNQIELVGAWWYLADWASTRGSFPLQDIQYWSDYVYTMVTRYRGVVKYWECWNEFNGAFGKKGTVSDYAQMLKHGYDAAKQADPNCRVGISCASTDVRFFERVIEAGASDCFDFVCIHPYESSSALVKDGRVMEFLNVTKSVRAMLEAHNQAADTEIWITECGHPAPPADSMDEQLQAESLVKLYVLGFAQGIDKIFWFEGQGPNYPDGNFGVIRNDWSKRPAYEALATMAALMGPHPEYAGWLSLTDESYGFVFGGGAPSVLVAWAKSDDLLRFSNAVTVIDLDGSNQLVPAGQDVALTRTPRFITGVSATLLADASSHIGQEFPWTTFSGSGDAYVSLGATNLEHGVCQLNAFGQALPGQVGRSWARRTPTQVGNEFRSIAFDVDDSYVGYGDNQIEITATARRVDPTVNTGVNLVYESSDGYTNYGQWWTIPSDSNWHQKTYTLTNACFVNKWGWNFAFQNETSGDLWIREVRVRKIPPPAIADR